MTRVIAIVFLACLVCDGLTAQEVPLHKQVETFLKKNAADAERDRPIPKSCRQWQKQAATLRTKFWERLGDLPDRPWPLQPHVVRRIEREEYSIEVVHFQSREGVYVTGTLHLPKVEDGKKVPAVLNLMGHQESPVNNTVQLRALSLVREGIAVLSLDPFGSAQRSITPHLPKEQQLNDAHGGRPGLALGALGAPLMGIEVYDHMRGLDYLESRPEINCHKLGVIGVSGGGTHALWITIADPRIKATVSVAGFTDFRTSFTWPHCPCDALPGGFQWATAAEAMSISPNGALLVILCTDDKEHPPTEIAERIERNVRPYFELCGSSERFATWIDPNPHSYSQPGREHTAGFLKRWLRGQGDGLPIPESGLEPEPANLLMAFPEGKRPSDFLTEPAFAFRRASELAAALPSPPKTKREWGRLRRKWSVSLDQILGPSPGPTDLNETITPQQQTQDFVSKRVVIEPEPAIQLAGNWMARTTSNALPHTAILFHPEGKEAPELGELRDRLVSAGWKTFAVDLRNTGESQWDFERIHGNYVALRDIVTHQISLWLGRPLMGQWVWDVRRCVDFIARDEDSGHVAVIGFGDTGLAAILEAGDDPRVDAVVTVGSLASFVSPNGFGKPWRKWTTDPCMPMRNAAAFVPNLFWKVADWPQLAAMACPRPLLIANPESGDKTPMSDADAKSTFSWTRSVYVVHDSSARFDTRTGATTDDIASWLEQAPFTNHEP